VPAPISALPKFSLYERGRRTSLTANLLTQGRVCVCRARRNSPMRAISTAPREYVAASWKTIAFTHPGNQCCNLSAKITACVRSTTQYVAIGTQIAINARRGVAAGSGSVRILVGLVC
jgi:hypothetical protein